MTCFVKDFFVESVTECSAYSTMASLYNPEQIFYLANCLTAKAAE